MYYIYWGLPEAEKSANEFVARLDNNDTCFIEDSANKSNHVKNEEELYKITAKKIAELVNTGCAPDDLYVFRKHDYRFDVKNT